MSTAALTINASSLEYQSYKTMAAAEHARLKVAQTQPRMIRVITECALWLPFRGVTRDTEKLVSLLEQMETRPSSVLLEDDTVTIPHSLHEVFRKMCAVIQRAESVRLHEGILLRGYIERLRDLSQQVNGFAVRYEDAQNKLRSRVPVEEVSDYQGSYAAYGNCGPKSEQGADDDDVKSELLHF